jgi:tRNA threonylcarbamoyladenosine biosynthesis protein TsaE
MKIALKDLPKTVKSFLEHVGDQSVVGLTGPIGAGKTTFIYHVLQQIDPQALPSFSSPTFTILNRYQTKLGTLNHVDLYRLNTYHDLESLDLLPLFKKQNTLTFIEWADKFSEVDAITTHTIKLQHIAGQPDLRDLTIA